jgi:hypothetical protein
MKSLPWSQTSVIADLKERIWAYLSPSSSPAEMLLDAAALLQMPEGDLVTLSRVMFVVSDEVGRLLGDIPRLLRRLPTVSTYEEERSTERLRGAIQWPLTLSARRAGGPPNLYVTRPAQRDFQNPENELLTFLLREIERLGEQTGWSDSKAEDAGRIVAARTAEATRWNRSRMLSGIEARPPTPRAVARIRSGRHCRRFHSSLDAWAVYQKLIDHLEPNAIRLAVERAALTTRTDSILFEIVCLFQVIDVLKDAGWSVPRLRVFRGRLESVATCHEQSLHIWYQSAPKALRHGSRYVDALQEHSFQNPMDLRPDLVLRLQNAGEPPRWLIIEAKLGEVRTVAASAREALQNLLAYKEAFSKGLGHQSAPIGLGVAWGEGLIPVRGTQMLCTPEHIETALNLFIENMTTTGDKPLSMTSGSD